MYEGRTLALDALTGASSPEQLRIWRELWGVAPSVMERSEQGTYPATLKRKAVAPELFIYHQSVATRVVCPQLMWSAPAKSTLECSATQDMVLPESLARKGVGDEAGWRVVPPV